MKRKSLLICGLLSLISSHVYSMELAGGKLLSHKEWTTGSGKAVFKQTNEKTAQLNKFKSKTKNQSDLNQFIHTYARSLDVDSGGFFNNLSGYHEAQLYNQSDIPRTYVVKKSVCAYEQVGSLVRVDSCAISEDEVLLEYYGASFGENAITSLLISKSKMKDKDYIVHTETEITNKTDGTVIVTEDDKLVPKS